MSLWISPFASYDAISIRRRQSDHDVTCSRRSRWIKHYSYSGLRWLRKGDWWGGLPWKPTSTKLHKWLCREWWWLLCLCGRNGHGTRGEGRYACVCFQGGDQCNSRIWLRNSNTNSADIPRELQESFSSSNHWCTVWLEILQPVWWSDQLGYI